MPKGEGEPVGPVSAFAAPSPKEHMTGPWEKAGMNGAC